MDKETIEIPDHEDEALGMVKTDENDLHTTYRLNPWPFAPGPLEVSLPGIWVKAAPPDGERLPLDGAEQVTLAWSLIPAAG